MQWLIKYNSDKISTYVLMNDRECAFTTAAVVNKRWSCSQPVVVESSGRRGVDAKITHDKSHAGKSEEQN